MNVGWPSKYEDSGSVGFFLEGFCLSVHTFQNHVFTKILKSKWGGGATASSVLTKFHLNL
jgi:hypothetical protein